MKGGRDTGSNMKRLSLSSVYVVKV